ncbi:MAG: hypothetical protein RJA22_3180 [Verrucomicrobiota bacterium]
MGIEPTTYGLRNRCSTTELHWPRDRRRGRDGSVYSGLPPPGQTPYPLPSPVPGRPSGAATLTEPRAKEVRRRSGWTHTNAAPKPGAPAVPRNKGGQMFVSISIRRRLTIRGESPGASGPRHPHGHHHTPSLPRRGPRPGRLARLPAVPRAHRRATGPQHEGPASLPGPAHAAGSLPARGRPGPRPPGGPGRQSPLCRARPGHRQQPHGPVHGRVPEPPRSSAADHANCAKMCSKVGNRRRAASRCPPFKQAGRERPCPAPGGREFTEASLPPTQGQVSRGLRFRYPPPTRTREPSSTGDAAPLAGPCPIRSDFLRVSDLQISGFPPRSGGGGFSFTVPCRVLLSAPF